MPQLSEQTSVSYTFTNLGLSRPLFLTVTLVSALLKGSGAAVSISVGPSLSNLSTVVATDCAPAAACTFAAPSSCVANYPVPIWAVGSALGGSLVVSAQQMGQLQGTVATCYVSANQPALFVAAVEVSTITEPTMRPVLAVASAQPSMRSVVSGVASGVVAVKGAPLYVVFLVAAMYCALGVLIVRAREKFSDVAQLLLVQTCIDLSLLGISFISEVFFVASLLLAARFRALGVVVLCARLMHVFPAGFLLVRVMGPKLLSHAYAASVHRKNLFDNAQLYGGLALLMLVEVPLAKYLPWCTSPFAEVSGGFPDIYLFRLCSYVKLTQTLVALIAQFVYLASANLSEISANPQAAVLVFVYVASTVVSGTLALMSTVLKGKALKNLKILPAFAFQGRASESAGGVELSDFHEKHDIQMDGFSVENPIQSSSSPFDGEVEMSVVVQASSGDGRNSSSHIPPPPRDPSSLQSQHRVPRMPRLDKSQSQSQPPLLGDQQPPEVSKKSELASQEVGELFERYYLAELEKKMVLELKREIDIKDQQLAELEEKQALKDKELDELKEKQALKDKQLDVLEKLALELDRVHRHDEMLSRVDWGRLQALLLQTDLAPALTDEDPHPHLHPPLSAASSTQVSSPRSEWLLGALLGSPLGAGLSEEAQRRFAESSGYELSQPATAFLLGYPYEAADGSRAAHFLRDHCGLRPAEATQLHSFLASP